MICPLFYQKYNLKILFFHHLYLHLMTLMNCNFNFNFQFHFHFHFHLLDFLTLVFYLLKLYLINHWINLIILFVQGCIFYILLFLRFLARLMYLNFFSRYCTNCIIFDIIKQVFNFSIPKFTYFMPLIKFVAVNNS